MLCCCKWRSHRLWQVNSRSCFKCTNQVDFSRKSHHMCKFLRGTTYHTTRSCRNQHESRIGQRLNSFFHDGTQPEPFGSPTVRRTKGDTVPGTTGGTIVCARRTRYNLVQKTDGNCPPVLTPTVVQLSVHSITVLVLPCNVLIHSEFACCSSTVHIKQSTLPAADPLDYQVSTIFENSLLHNTWSFSKSPIEVQQTVVQYLNWNPIRYAYTVFHMYSRVQCRYTSTLYSVLWRSTRYSTCTMC